MTHRQLQELLTEDSEVSNTGSLLGQYVGGVNIPSNIYSNNNNNQNVLATTRLNGGNAVSNGSSDPIRTNCLQNNGHCGWLPGLGKCTER